MLTYMADKSSKDALEAQVQDFASRYGATFKQAWDEVRLWYRCDELNRGDAAQESAN